MAEAAKYLASEYNGKVIQVISGHCPKCLKGGSPKTLHIPKHSKEVFWNGLFGNVYSYQALHAFIPKTTTSVSHFKHPLLDMLEPGEGCADKTKCFPVCMFCHAIIAQGQGKMIPTVNAPMPSVHLECMTTCAYIPPGKGKQHRCQAPVPSIPQYIVGPPAAKCMAHSEVQQGKPPARPYPPPPTKPAPMRSAPSPPPVHSKPKQEAQRKPTKLEKDPERGRSKDLSQMWGGGKRAREEAGGVDNGVGNGFGNGVGNGAEQNHPCVVFTPHPHMAHKYPRKVFDYTP